MRIRLTISIVFLMMMEFCFAQQNPHFTQYMYNARSVNPAYMLNELGIVEVGVINRTQWVGLEGGPKTVNVFASIPLLSSLEVGTSYNRDAIGSKISLITDSFSVDGAYKIRLSEGIEMSAGLKMGFNTVSLNAFDPKIQDDPIFDRNTKRTMFNLGAGCYFFNDDFYVGISVPNFIKETLSKDLNKPIYQQEIHTYMMAGYIYSLSSNVRFKPSLAFKYVQGITTSFDLSMNVLLYDKFELGVSNRNQDAFSILTSCYLTHNLKFGYSYDFGIGNLRNYHHGSHEVVLVYSFDVLGLSKSYKSPRFY